MLEKNFSKESSKLVRKQTKYKGNVSYIEETFFFNIKYNKSSNKTLKYKWTITLERYEVYKMIVVSFYLTKYKNAKRIKLYKRNNRPEDYISPTAVFMLFEECFNICTERPENKEYSFCFYALDDEYIPPEKKEDINKRMSAYYSYLERQNRLSKNQLKLRQKGDLSNNLFVGYNEKYRNEQDVDNFIDFYKPIILKEIKYLYGDESLRLKTEVKKA